jgi:protein HIRA/HIR1
VSGKQTQWLDYLPVPALAIKATSFFCAVAMLDGSVVVYSHTGRRYVQTFDLNEVLSHCFVVRFMPTLTLGAPCSYMEATKHALLIITSTGQLYSWSVP